MPDVSKIEKAKAKHEAVDILIDTIEHEHQAAYTTAVDRLLKNEKGQIDYAKLKEGKVQRKMAEEMTEHYLTKAKQRFGIDLNKKLDEAEQSMLLSAYAGITKEELLTIIKERKHQFTHSEFKNTVSQIKNRIDSRLRPSAYGHLDEEDKPAIIKHIGLEDMIDHEKITLQESVGLLQKYFVNKGHVPGESYEGEIYHKKPAKQQARIS